MVIPLKSSSLAHGAIICLVILVSASNMGLSWRVLYATGEGLTANVGLTPLNINARQGEVFTVNLTISNIENLFAYEIMVWYNNSVIGATAVTRPSGHFLQPVNPDYFFEVRWEIRNDWNATHGRIWLAYTLLAPEAPRSGDGVLAVITFQGLASGTTPIILNDCPGRQGPVKLADGIVGLPISHTADEGFVQVQARLNGDVNGDGKVDAIDLTAVAIAFGAKVDDSRWNPDADLDKNGVVNILDLLRVLTNYGKTS